MQNLEAACRRILGRARWETSFEQLSPGQLMEACAMLEEGWDPQIVEEAVFILQRYFWFKMIGITVPPWELRDEHWRQLISAAPWGRVQQGALF